MIITKQYLKKLIREELDMSGFNQLTTTSAIEALAPMIPAIVSWMQKLEKAVLEQHAEIQSNDQGYDHAPLIRALFDAGVDVRNLFNKWTGWGEGHPQKVAKAIVRIFADEMAKSHSLESQQAVTSDVLLKVFPLRLDGHSGEGYFARKERTDANLLKIKPILHFTEQVYKHYIALAQPLLDEFKLKNTTTSSQGDMGMGRASADALKNSAP